ncbi:MAG: tetratricopeptide repeat protein [Planctomycetota bacterium]
MLALLFGLCLVLGDSGELERAERAWRAGRYGEAFAAYERALSDPELPRGALLYNLGNCAYRRGRRAEALLYYRRARLHMPDDGELLFNLRLVLNELGLESGEGWRDPISPAPLLLLVTLLQSAGLLGLLLPGLRRRARRLLLLCLPLGLLGAARLVQTRCLPSPLEAVVLAERIVLRPEPHRDLAPVLELEAGQLLRVAEASDRWLRVLHPLGSGWTEARTVGLIER